MLNFVRAAVDNRKLIFQLAIRDITSAYSGSVLGRAWILVDPLVNVVLTLVFFQFAMKGSGSGDVPYVAWVLPQIIFWTFVSAAINSTVGSIREYSYLMRHIDFDMRLVVVIKLIGAAFVHFALLTIVLFSLQVFFDVRIGRHTFGLMYYFLSMLCLLVAIGWIVSSLGLFWKDVRNIVSIMLQVGFWVSPVFWEPDRFPRMIEMLMYANPFYYPIHGYRVTVLHTNFGVHFWYATGYFWGLVALLLLLGNHIFVKLSRGFGDVV